MRKRAERKENNRSSSFERLTARLAGGGRVLLLVLVCLAVLMAAGKLNFALAVNLDGDLLGYVDSLQEFNDLVKQVGYSVSDALGQEWEPALTTYVALGAVDPAENKVAERLIASVDEVRELQVVYVDGSAVCAYEKREEAVRALKELIGAYVSEDAEGVSVLENIVIGTGVVDTRLLEYADESLAEAVTVETSRVFTADTVLPYPTEIIEDSRLYEDEFYVLTPGTAGSEHIEYQAVYNNGAMVGCREVMRVQEDPVPEVRVVGTRVHHSVGNYIWPVAEGWLTSYFGYRNSSVGSSDHKGVDIANDAGTEIMAADGGTVIFSGTYNGYGLLIEIQHENGDITYYAHNSENLVEEGDVVDQGEVIARMGCTGVASGNHVHFEFHPRGGEAEDPMEYMPECPFPYLET